MSSEEEELVTEYCAVALLLVHMLLKISILEIELVSCMLLAI